MKIRHRKNFRVIGPSNSDGQYCMTLRGAKRIGKKWQNEGKEAFVQESYGNDKWETMEYFDAE